jgi:hypothetical protein
VFAVLPLYESCEVILGTYESKLHDLGYDIQFRPIHFSAKPKAHPGLTGYVELSGSLSDVEVSDILNGLKIACLPEDTIQMDVSELALLHLPDTLQEHRTMTEQYLAIEDGKITIYQNNSTKSQRRTTVE